MKLECDFVESVIARCHVGTSLVQFPQKSNPLNMLSCYKTLNGTSSEHLHQHLCEVCNIIVLKSHVISRTYTHVPVHLRRVTDFLFGFTSLSTFASLSHSFFGNGISGREPFLSAA